MKNFTYLILLLIIFSYCKKKESGTIETKYSIKIEYNSLPVFDTRKMVDDSLTIVFRGSFIEDTFSLDINQNYSKDLILTTDERTGWSGDIKPMKYKDVKSIEIRINNGNLIYIEPPSRHYNIQLLYIDSTATVSFHRRLPA
ncbi:hypothetical protein [Saccharicrinis sp. FJH54]|uniref:hypothetical protein n=1 Tax=Saccharicrinis sp. FJH54 TaxID=3344665 RepID=UPI0035D48333